MQNSPLVSVICLCYNHAKFVEAALNSVLNQTYQNIELLIADDCSSDDSEQVIKKWLQQHPGIVFISNPANIGNTKTFNKLLQLAKGDYIIDLAADDVLLPHCIEKQLYTFQNTKHKNVGIVYGNAELISEENKPLGYYYNQDQNGKIENLPPSGDIYLSVLSQSHKICSVSSLIKRDVLESLSGYDENLAYEDLDLWVRASRYYHFDFIEDTLVQKRIAVNSLGSQFYNRFNSRTRKINHSSYLVIKKAIRQNKNTEENKALLKRLHFEMFKSYKSFDILLFLKYIILELKLRFS
ncbi:glycosyltransferase [Flavobacterium enshiense]|uniref:glycosyltransferase family 2 protein n=1 Tax=Flavobacterium enshiense TaxID=1341165 RepID=UPI00345D0DFE